MPVVAGIMFLAVLVFVVVDRLMDRPSPDDQAAGPRFL